MIVDLQQEQEQQPQEVNNVNRLCNGCYLPPTSPTPSRSDYAQPQQHHVSLFASSSFMSKDRDDRNDGMSEEHMTMTTTTKAPTAAPTAATATGSTTTTTTDPFPMDVTTSATITPLLEDVHCDPVLDTMDSWVGCVEGVDLQHDFEERLKRRDAVDGPKILGFRSTRSLGTTPSSTTLFPAATTTANTTSTAHHEMFQSRSMSPTKVGMLTQQEAAMIRLQLMESRHEARHQQQPPPVLPPIQDRQEVQDSIPSLVFQLADLDLLHLCGSHDEMEDRTTTTKMATATAPLKKNTQPPASSSSSSPPPPPSSSSISFSWQAPFVSSNNNFPSVMLTNHSLTSCVGCEPSVEDDPDTNKDTLVVLEH